MQRLVLLTLACCGPTSPGGSATADPLELWFSRTGIVPTRTCD